VLHGPSRRHGLDRTDREVWRAMEELYAAGKTRFLGISNVALEQVEALWEQAVTRPAFVQNRCYASMGWDRDVRAFCRDHGIVYQGFSLLTANANELRHPRFRTLASRLGRTPAQIVFRFAIQAGMVPLTGTTDPAHMHEDLDIDGFELTPEEMRMMENLGM
jgi:diketogulonate reductase-like aldo/keto reductase